MFKRLIRAFKRYFDLALAISMIAVLSPLCVPAHADDITSSLTPKNPVVATDFTNGNFLQPIFGTCSLGFSSHIGDRDYIVSAGHCQHGGNVVYSEIYGYMGYVASYRYGNDLDYSLIRVPHTYSGQHKAKFNKLGTMHNRMRICFKSRNNIFRRCGRVLDDVVKPYTYDDGTTVDGVKINIPSIPGDSGATIYSGKTVYGILSAGDVKDNFSVVVPIKNIFAEKAGIKLGWYNAHR
jgi:hypothetical protein